MAESRLLKKDLFGEVRQESVANEASIFRDASTARLSAAGSLAGGRGEQR